MIGQTLNHYRVTALLGEGGMGAVYAAEDTKLGRRVALKVLPPDLAGDPERLARFQREARAVAALNHPNIVVLHSVEEADGTHFLTMELVDGQSLSDLIPSGGLLLDDLLRHGIALADAVSAAHDRGITHRDLKPANVMVNAEGRVKVLDFGLAKLTEPEALEDDVTQLETASLSGLTGEGKVLGTTAYMAPEQAEGKSVDSRTDIFAMGTILYQMATGERPFTGDTAVSVISSILKDTPSAVTAVRVGLPRHLGRIVSRCLEKNPEQRYQSAKDLRNELAGLEREIATGQHPGSGPLVGSGATAGPPPGGRDVGSGSPPLGTQSSGTQFSGTTPSGSVPPGTQPAPSQLPSDPSGSGPGAPSGTTQPPSSPSAGFDQPPLTPESPIVPSKGNRGLVLGLALVVVVAVALVFWLNRTPKAPAAPTLYTFATADAISGTYYPLGRGIAELVERAMPGVRIEVVPTEGSFENARLLESGEAQLAFMQSDIAFHSVKTDRVLGHRSDTIVGLAALYREYFHAVVRKDSGIETVNDLSKQRVSINLPNSGSRFTNDVVLEHFGVELAEENTRFLSTRDANIEILGGGLDASLQWFAAPHPNMVGVFRSGDVRLLQIPADLARGLQASQPFLLPGQIPGGTYPEQTEAVETVVVKALLVGRRDLPDEFVEGLLEVLFAGVADLIAAHPRAAEISLGAAFGLEDGMSIELHPSASNRRRPEP